VRALNADGTSGASNEVVVVTPGQSGDLPAAPTELIPVDAQGSRVGVRWTAPAIGSVAGYVLEAGTGAGLQDIGRVAIAGGTTSVMWDSAIVPFASYYVRVRAMNSVGEGRATEDLRMTSGREGLPGPPTSVDANIRDGQAIFTWAAPSNGGEATGYVLEAGTLPGASNLYAAPRGPSEMAFQFPVVPGTRYYLRVRGFNTSGIGAASEEVVVSSGGMGELPGTPRELTATVVGDQLTLRWLEQAAGGAVSDYVVEAGSAPGLSDIAVIRAGSTAAEWRYSGVPEGQTFYIRVRGLNSVGVGPHSNAVTIGAPRE